MVAISDDVLIETLNNSVWALGKSIEAPNYEDRMVYATQSIARSNLVIAELLMRQEHNKNCKR